METLVLDGKSYVKASVAARNAGYTSDYVGQLCRSGKIDAHLIGRSWYVNPDQLGDHRTEKKRTSRIKAREQVRRAVLERQQTMQEATSIGIRKPAHFEKRSIRYESDETDLLPEMKKLKVEVEPVQITKKIKAKKEERAKNFEVVNEGNEIVMSGDIRVIDATDEEFLGNDTVVLSADIMHAKARVKKKVPKKIDNKIDEPVGQKAGTKTDFLTKLMELEDENRTVVQDAAPVEADSELDNTQTEASIDHARTLRPKTESGGSLRIVLVALVVISALFSLGSVFIESNWDYNETGLESKLNFKSDFNFKYTR